MLLEAYEFLPGRMGVGFDVDNFVKLVEDVDHSPDSCL